MKGTLRPYGSLVEKEDYNNKRGGPIRRRRLGGISSLSPRQVQPSPSLQQQRSSASSPSPSNQRSPITRLVRARKFWAPLEDDDANNGGGGADKKEEEVGTEVELRKRDKTNDEDDIEPPMFRVSSEYDVVEALPQYLEDDENENDSETEFDAFVQEDRGPLTIAIEQNQAALVIQREYRDYMARKHWRIWAVESAVTAASMGNNLQQPERSGDDNDNDDNDNDDDNDTTNGAGGGGINYIYYGVVRSSSGTTTSGSVAASSGYRAADEGDDDDDDVDDDNNDDEDDDDNEEEEEDPVAWMAAEFAGSGHDKMNKNGVDPKDDADPEQPLALSHPPPEKPAPHDNNDNDDDPIVYARNDVTIDTLREDDDEEEDDTVGWLQGRGETDADNVDRNVAAAQRKRALVILAAVWVAVALIATLTGMLVVRRQQANRDAAAAGSNKEPPPVGSLTCPNVTTTPDLYMAFASIDLVVANQTHLRPHQAQALGATFATSYNERIGGCDSDFARVAQSCTVPCEKKEADEEAKCCRPVQQVPGLNDESTTALRCDIECTVHCNGCYAGEPLFGRGGGANNNKTDTALDENNSVSDNNNSLAGEFNQDDGNDNGRTLNIFSNGIVEQQQEEEEEENNSCASPICQFQNTLERQICESILADQPSSSEQVDKCSVIGISTLDSITGETVQVVSSSGVVVVDDPPAATPTLEPTPPLLPAATPTPSPSSVPSNVLSSPNPSVAASRAPTDHPTPRPSRQPSPRPTRSPTRAPTVSPTSAPTTSRPTKSPTSSPTTSRPTDTPTNRPTKTPTNSPTRSPTVSPTNSPTRSPTVSPTSSPTTSPPTQLPTTRSPTSRPTGSRISTKSPTRRPSEAPKTKEPTRRPTPRPVAVSGPSTKSPYSSRRPSEFPTKLPSSSRPSFDVPSDTDADLIFYLLDTDYDFAIRELKDGGVIDLSRDGKFLSIEAVPTGRNYRGDRVQSIVFTLDGQVYQIESTPPFTLGADEDRIEYKAVPALTELGTHQLVATAYTRANARGRILSTTVVTFQVRAYWADR